MSTGKRLGGKEAAAKGRFLNHLNFGYAKHIKVREKPSEDALEQMQRTNISKEVIDRYCNGIEFDCMSCMVHAICMKNLNGGLEIYSDIYCQSPVTFGKKGLTFIKRKPSDVLILNQVTNLNAWMEAIGNEDYDHIYLLLPLSTAGRTLSKTIEELYKSSTRNCSNIYSCFPRLTDFARHKDTMLNASKIKL